MLVTRHRDLQVRVLSNELFYSGFHFHLRLKIPVYQAINVPQVAWRSLFKAPGGRSRCPQGHAAEELSARRLKAIVKKSDSRRAVSVVPTGGSKAA